MAPASAHAAWAPATNVSAVGTGDFLDLDSSQSPNGRAIALWTYLPASGNAREGRIFTATATQTSGFARRRSMLLAPVGQAFFRAAIADNGQGLVVFQEVVRVRRRTTHRIQAIRVLPSGALRPPFTVSLRGVDALTPQVATLPRGRFVVVWRTRTGAVQAAKVSAGHREGPVRTLGRGATASVGAATAGEDVAVTYETPQSSRIVLWPGGDVPSASASLGTGRGNPVVRGAGSSFVVGTSGAVGGDQVVNVQRFSATGPVEGATTYTSASSTARVAMASTGAAIVAWEHLERGTPSTTSIAVASAPALEMPFGSQQLFAGDVRPALSAEPVAVNARGDAVVVYAYAGQSATSGRAFVRPAGGAFGAPTDLGESDSHTVVLREDGSAIVTFLRPSGNGSAVATAQYTP
jgi:hypothetical protein